jgi:hypothetical protein
MNVFDKEGNLKGGNQTEDAMKPKQPSFLKRMIQSFKKDKAPKP